MGPQVMQLVQHDIRIYCIEGRAVINEEQPDIVVPVLQVAKY